MIIYRYKEVSLWNSNAASADISINTTQKVQGGGTSRSPAGTAETPEFGIRNPPPPPATAFPNGAGPPRNRSRTIKTSENRFGDRFFFREKRNGPHPKEKSLSGAVQSTSISGAVEHCDHWEAPLPGVTPCVCSAFGADAHPLGAPGGNLHSGVPAPQLLHSAAPAP